jgi:hypothetical protein
MNFLEHDSSLSLDLLSRQARTEDRLEELLERMCRDGGRRRDVDAGLVVRGVGVDVTAERLDRGRQIDGTRGAVAMRLEHEVLEEVSHAVLVLSLDRGAGGDPQL